MKKLLLLLSVGVLVCLFSSCKEKEKTPRTNKIVIVEDGISSVVCKVKADTIVIDDIKILVYPIEDERWCYITGEYAELSTRIFIRLRIQHPDWETVSVSVISGSESSEFALGIFREKSKLKSVPE